MAQRDALAESLAQAEQASASAQRKEEETRTAEAARLENAKRDKAKLESALAEADAKRTQLESYWHSYYQKEMENILVEKVKHLQGQVRQLENDLQAEREAELKRLRGQHDQAVRK
jgi:chromosome segregation ATPase